MKSIDSVLIADPMMWQINNGLQHNKMLGDVKSGYEIFFFN